MIYTIKTTTGVLLTLMEKAIVKTKTEIMVKKILRNNRGDEDEDDNDNYDEMMITIATTIVIMIIMIVIIINKTHSYLSGSGRLMVTMMKVSLISIENGTYSNNTIITIIVTNRIELGKKTMIIIL